MRAILFISILLINNTVLNAQTWQNRYQQLVDKGDELYFEYKYDEAVPLFEEAYSISTEYLSMDEVYYATISLIITLKNNGSSITARDFINDSYPIYKDQFDDRQKGRILYQYGTILHLLSEFEESINILSEADRYINLANDKGYFGYPLAYSAQPLVNLGRYDEALEKLEEASKSVDTSVDLSALININYYLIYSYQNQQNAGFEYLMNAYDLVRDNGSPSRYLNVLVQLTYHHSLQNSYRESLSYAIEGLELAEKINSKKQAANLHDLLGRIYIQLGEYELSLDHYNQAIRIHESNGDFSTANALKISIAFLLVTTNEFSLAEKTIQEVLQNERDPYQRLRVLLANSNLESKRGNFEKAKEHLDIALSELSYEQQSSAHFIYDQYMDLPQISDEERVKFGIDVLESARNRSMYNMMRAELDLSEAYQPINTDSSFKYAYSSINKLETRRTSTSVNSIKTRLNANWQSFYFKVASWEVIHNMDYEKAFELFELSKSRALFDQIYENQQTELLSPENPESFRILELQKMIDLEYRKIESSSIDGSIENNSLRISQLELEYQTATETLISESPEWGSLEYPEVSKLGEVKELLEEHTAYLSYGIRHDELFIFLLTKEDEIFKSVSFEGDAKNALAIQVNELRNAIIQIDDVISIEEQSKKLVRLILEPIIENLDGISHLIVSPDGPLHLLPFESLIYNNQYLIERFSVKYIPSISVYDVIEYTEASSFDKELLALAGSGFESVDGYFTTGSQSSFATLPYALAEVDSISNYFSNSTVLKNEEVSEFAFKNLALSDYRYVHLASHGYIDERFPDQSGLIMSKKIGTESLFGEDGYLNAREFSQLNIPAEMVVLSACNTGTGKVISGEGVMGLQRAMLSAGASSVLVSLWNIFDRSTPIFMNKFYHQLLEFEDQETSIIDRIKMYADMYEPDLIDYKTLALQEAKIEMINHPYYNHPVHWAPFILTGK